MKKQEKQINLTVLSKMTVNLYWKVLFSFSLVLGIMLCTLLLFKKFSRGYPSKKGNLTVGESVILDSKRRVVILKYKDSKYLILIGGNTDLVIKQENED